MLMEEVCPDAARTGRGPRRRSGKRVADARKYVVCQMARIGENRPQGELNEGFVWISNRNSVEQQFICCQEVNYIARHFG